jgi:hypothetical protein
LARAKIVLGNYNSVRMAYGQAKPPRLSTCVV